MIESLCKEQLLWLPEQGIGYYPVTPCEYGEKYFEKYQGYEKDIGEKITQSRIDLVRRHWQGDVLDVGIGSGQFVRGIDGKGFDVNPTAIHWLVENDKFLDLYHHEVEAVCFWDSLEHIQAADKAVFQVKKWMFISLPIFRNVEHVLTSKHFRKDEHYWYWTDAGFVRWMAQQGFDLVERSTMESDLGREDIGSYVFRRV